MERIILSRNQLEAIRNLKGPAATGLVLDGITIGEEGPVELEFSDTPHGISSRESLEELINLLNVR